jgi:hypothetical protein
MTKLTRYIETISDKSRLALAVAGVLGTLMGVPGNAVAGNFLDRLAGELTGTQSSGRTYTLRDIQTAVAFNQRITDNLSDLVDLSRSMQRIDLYGQFSGAETASKIKAAYLYEYSRAPYPELRQYDRLMLSVANSVRDDRIRMVADDANRKKEVLRDGTTLVDQIAVALRQEDYGSVQRMVRTFSRMMENQAVPLLQGQRSRGREMVQAEEQQDFGLPFGR